MKRDQASEAQIAAADPGTSTWVSANAGSGKTKVLTDRVARLLLDGVPPQSILCLTYTKAAATEMQNRLFKRLGQWVMEADTSLEEALDELGVPATENTKLARDEARTLFARAIETPGGLKIQTIHSFCAALLRQFPIEAGVSPNFRELDARDAKELRAQILDEIAEAPEGSRLSDLAAHVTDAKIDELGDELARERERLAGPISSGEVFGELGIDPDLTLDALVKETVLPGDRELTGRLLTALRTGSDRDTRAASKLANLPSQGSDPGWLLVLESVFLFGEKAADPFGPKVGKFPTKPTRDRLGDDAAALDDLMQRVADTRPRRLALEAAQKTIALLRFAEVFLPRYAEAKTARGVLDFDDQILKARALLSDARVAQWVLYRLDGGIDHMLVDEAQDTSPAQWDVIRLLAEEFSTGDGVRAELARTIFVVGDKKQSIYSFQGADPSGFDRMRDHFKARLTAAKKPFRTEQLHYSFRSAPAILRFVDDAFAALGHTGLRDTSEHIAFRNAMPGRVDLWPALEKSRDGDECPWTETVDQPAEDDPRLVLARTIAIEIKRMIDSGVQIEDQKGVVRPVTPKDFLVLVRRRSEIFHEIIRACKDIGVPIAGSDRLRVGAELAVRDLLALLNFAATPEDDLALACALRSPLVGWSEAQLYALAQPRKGHLWAALRDTTEQHTETREFLGDILKNADFLRPYELLERILTRHGGRIKLLARLGREAEDGIDALLDQAISYEAGHIPSLTGFLSWFHASEEDNKRQLDGSRDEVRVMTVHGAKGLEGRIVILPDCTKPAGRGGHKTTLRMGEDAMVWRSAKAEAPPAIADALEEENRLEREERMRLLYVALTRAESWLIVAASGDTGSGSDSWYSIVAETIERHSASTPFETPLGPGLRFEEGVWTEPTGHAPTPRRTASVTLPDWVRDPAPAPPKKPVIVNPSKLGGEKIVASGGEGDEMETALQRGTRVHLLLEYLPQVAEDQRRGAARRLLDARDPAPSPDEFEDVLTEATRVLSEPALAHVFAPEALAEVNVAAVLPGIDARMFGSIDRLIVEPGRVCAVDFKTNAVVPETPEGTPEGLLRQMGAYASALAQIYPDRRIETAILWTRTAMLMPLSHEVVTAALARAEPA